MEKKVIGICGYMQNGKDTTADMILKKMDTKKESKLFGMIKGEAAYYGFKYSFAGPLKKLCASAFDLPISMFYSEFQKTKAVMINLNANVVKAGIAEWVKTYVLSSDKWAYLARTHSIEANNFAETLAGVIVDVFKSDEEVEHIRGSEYRTTVRRIAQLMGTEVVRNNLDDGFWVDIKEEPFGRRFCVVPDVRFPNEAEFVDVLIRVIDPRKDNKHTHASESFIKTFTPDYDIVNDGTVEDLEKKVSKIVKELKGEFASE